MEAQLLLNLGTKMEFSALLLPVSLTILLFISLYFFNNILPLIRSLPLIVKNSHRMTDWAAELLLASPTCTVTVGPIVLTADPLNVEHMTKTHFTSYKRSSFATSSLHDFLGHGIVNVDGERWKIQRKMASHQFSTGSIRTFVLEVLRHGIQQRLLPLLTSASRNGEALDLQDVLERFAFDGICRLVLDCDPDCLSKRNESGERFYRAFEEAVHLSVERVNLPFSVIWKLKKLLDIGSERRLRESMAIVNGYLLERIRNSRRILDDAENMERRDFLSQFAKDGRQSDEFLRDILVNFLLAGRDTTPSALTWFFWQVSSRRDVVGKILEELRLIRESREISGPFTLDSIREMDYLQAAISESMRLYPPVSLLGRESEADDTLPDGTAVRKGWMVMYSAMAMGRSKRIWGADCAEFRPERWLLDGVFRGRSLFEYPVFHAGPRVCLGKEMAFIQMKAVAASILERFEIEVVEERGKHEAQITLKMEGGLPVRFRERN